MFNLEGKIACVTGSEGLLGKQFCQALEEYGAEVYKLDIKTGFDCLNDFLPECDILVNCARTTWEPMHRLSMQMTRGSIINIASVYSVIAPDQRIYKDTEIANSPASYSADKAAVIGLTRHLASELAPKGIRVNAISPGGIEDNHSDEFIINYSLRTPLKRMAMKREMSGAVIYLASDASSYMTGQNLIIDGGRSIW